MLAEQVLSWLDRQHITGKNIGTIRRQLFMPFDCEWNAFVRDATAARERSTTCCTCSDHRAINEALATDPINDTRNDTHPAGTDH